MRTKIVISPKPPTTAENVAVGKFYSWGPGQDIYLRFHGGSLCLHSEEVLLVANQNHRGHFATAVKVYEQVGALELAPV